MKPNACFFRSLGLVAALSITTVAQADPVLEYDTFGPLAGATFGGSGIPNDAVAISTIVDGGVTITLGLAASQRYDNPALTNDGAGTFYAQPGTSIEGPSNINGALWNFNYYIDIVGATFDDYDFLLRYDTSPTGEDFGELDFGGALGGNASFVTQLQGSENLLFSWTSTPVAGVVTPSGTSFDPFAPGLYSFELVAYSSGFVTELGRTEMNVSVVPVPPAAGLGMLGFALVGIVRRRARGSISAV